MTGVDSLWSYQRLGLRDERLGSLFNNCQPLALITFAERVRQAHERTVTDGHEPKFAKALAMYLALAVDRLANYVVETLAASGCGRSAAFYRVARAVSEALPTESKEKKLLDGFLVGWERMQEQVAQIAGQGRLFG